jgi:glycosyltransferase involved in cell wall biosynthesis
MNILHINNTDLPGRRFNGYDLHISLNAAGHSAKQMVLHKRSDLDSVVPIHSKQELFFKTVLNEWQRYAGMDGLLSPTAHKLLRHPDFAAADIVHYHLVHNNLISVLDMPKLTKAKPSVWTIHDPWFFAGGCIYPLDCTGYKRVCGECGLPKTEQMLAIKKDIYRHMDVGLIVASRFTMNCFRESPVAKHFARVSLIPFGIDVDRFGTTNKTAAKEKLKMKDGKTVVAFRTEKSPLKGCQFIYEALDLIETPDKIKVLTVGSAGLPEELASRFDAVQLGWRDDEETMSCFYAAADIFLMPSLAESFGLMAVEAMAAGCAVVVFADTALADTAFAPDCAVPVPYKDSRALAKAVDRLAASADERLRRGRRGQELARAHYDYDLYTERHMALYGEILERNG